MYNKSLFIILMTILTASISNALESNYFTQLQAKQNQFKVEAGSVSQYEADTLDQEKLSELDITHLNYDYGLGDQITLGFGITTVSGQTYGHLKDGSLIQADVDGIKNFNVSALRSFDLNNSKLFFKANLQFALDKYRLKIANQTANASIGQHVVGVEIGYLHDFEQLKVGINLYRSYQFPGKAVFTDVGTSRNIELLGGGQANLKLYATMNNQFQPTMAVFQNTVFNTNYKSSSQNLITSTDEYWTRGYEFNTVFQLNDQWSIMPTIIRSEHFSLQSTNLISTQYKMEVRYLF